MSRKSLDELGPKRRRQRLRCLLDNIDGDGDLQPDVGVQPPEIGDNNNDDGNGGEARPMSDSDVDSCHSDVMGDREARFDNRQQSSQSEDGSTQGDVEMDHEILNEAEQGSNSNSEEEPSLIDSADDGSTFDDAGEESEEDENDGDGREDNDDQFRRNNADWQNHRPVYPGAPITVAQSLLIILALSLHHNLNMLCVEDIITVINLHCLQQGLAKMNLRTFQRYWCLDKATVKKHYYCSVCLRELESANHVCPSCPRRKNSYFIELPFVNQLKEMYQRDNFYDLLQWRFQRPLDRDGALRDVYDGSLYREWVQNGFLNNPHNISFSWYTDGVPVFKSSKISVWPMYLSINELPFEKRKMRENTLLLGLWFGKSKPDANQFVYKFRPQLERIAQGIQVNLPGRNDEILVRGVLLMGTCDLPAKASFLNMTHYNGEHGCSCCYIHGQSIPTDNGGHVYVFPYQNDLQSRTTDETIQHADQGTPDRPVMGVKGHTVFSILMPDYIRGMAIDRMHGVEGGIVEKILNLWFDAKFSAFPFSLHAFVDQINARLLSIKPPKFVHRMPRSVLDVANWKASELKLWFFYYSVPVLQGILRNDLFQHYLLLVVAISLLNSERVTPDMIQQARHLLHKFVREFQDLYGLRFCTMNVHQLLHLPDIVSNLGPLWAYSCFQYEDLNGQFLKLVHGTWHLDTQIAKKHQQIIAMVKLVDRLPEGPIRNFCNSRKRQVKIVEYIFQSCYSVGYYKKLVDVPEMIQTAMTNSGYPLYPSVRQYLRLLKGGQLYVAHQYKTNVLQTESFIVKYTGLDGNSKFGSIHSFVKTVLHCNCLLGMCLCRGTHYAIIEEVQTDEVFMARGDHMIVTTEEFLRKFHLTERVFAIPVERLETVCVRVKIENELYIGIPINLKDLE